MSNRTAPTTKTDTSSMFTNARIVQTSAGSSSKRRRVKERPASDSAAVDRSLGSLTDPDVHRLTQIKFAVPDDHNLREGGRHARDEPTSAGAARRSHRGRDRFRPSRKIGVGCILATLFPIASARSFGHPAATTANGTRAGADNRKS